jgi:Zn-dependent protease with chaperone function
MMRWLGFAELSVLVVFTAAAAAALLGAGVWPLLRRRIGGMHPAAAARRLWWLAAAPGLAPPVVLALCLLPSLLGADHCTLHAEHVHLCLRHLAAAQGGAAALLAAGGAGVLAWALAAGGVALVRAARVAAALAASARAGVAPDVSVLAADAPLSVCLGAFRPRILVSDGLLRALAPPALAAVLAHERTHARRRDALRALLARALSWPHLPPVRRELLAALALASERACDEAAAEDTGDRLLVAETILAVERLHAGAGAPRLLAASFGDGAVPARIEGLLAEPPRPADPSRAALHAAAAVATAIPLVEPLHHAVEHGLGALLSLL